MSQANVEAVRTAYDVAYAQRSVEGVREWFAADFQFHSRAEWPGRAVYGIDEMTDFWADLDETFGEYELAPSDFEPLGDYVLVTINQSVRMRGSDNSVRSTIYHLWRLNEGKPQEARSFTTREQALEAVEPRE